jgi:riboflavin kinase/FMN adenylyltransferase
MENYKADRAGIVSIGTFDGVHRGHLAILKDLKKAAEESGLYPIIVTFEPHPRRLVTPNDPPKLLTNLEEKIRILRDFVDGTLLVLKFNKELMNMTAREFIEEILLKTCRAAKMVVGYDHAFGKNRSGTIDKLKVLSEELSFDLTVVPPVLVDDMPISSTRIRRLIDGGEFRKARQLLGHDYPIMGRVTRGIGLGKKLGYPTANLDINSGKMLPVDGVYSCRVEITGRGYDGMMFIGKNHFNPDLKKSVEVNIFDFKDDLYDKDIICYPENYIRENRKYETPELLVKQIELDKQKVIKLKHKGA